MADRGPVGVDQEGDRREGNRWVGNPPKPEDVGAWFDGVTLDEGMVHADYIGGIVLIPQTEKVMRVGVDGQGNKGVIGRIERLVWTPYAKVETRIAYLRRLCELRNWVWEIEDVKPLIPDPILGPHFSRYVVKNNGGQDVPYITCSKRVRIFKALAAGTGRGAEVLVPSPGTKMVRVHGGYQSAIDPNMLAKAETGAVGRALGMAGMLVIPGSGVATADDMQELGGAPGADPELPGESTPTPPAAEEPQDIVARIAALSAQLEDEAPGKMNDIEEWAKGRKINLQDIKAAQQRAVLRKLEQALASSE